MVRDEEHRGAALPQDAVHDAVHQLRAHLVRVRVRVWVRGPLLTSPGLMHCRTRATSASWLGLGLGLGVGVGVGVGLGEGLGLDAQ